MAILQSPGTQITVTDQSMYASAGPGTVPLIFIATKENKLEPSQTGIAAGTTKANAGRLYSITSQRDLLQTFGDPVFYNISGNALNGYPLNEYGLLAAHSFLSISNLCRVVRADIDTAQLEPTVVEPSMPAAVGTYWFDLSSSAFGLFSRSGTAPNERWVSTTINHMFVDLPNNSVGNDSNHAVVFKSSTSTISYWVKVSGAWVEIDNTSARYSAIIENVWPDLTLYSDNYWIRTVSSAQGANVVLRRMDATLAQFVQVECPILPNDAAADIYYTNSPNGSRGQIYVRPVSSGTSSTANSLQFLINDASTGLWVALPNIVASKSVPRSGPVDGQLWFNAELGIDNNGYSTVDMLYNDGTGRWRNFNIPGFANTTDPSSPTLHLQSTDPRDIVPAVTLKVNDVWVDTDQRPYPLIRVWSGAAWITVDNTDQKSNRGIIFADARPHPMFRVGATDQGVNNGGTLTSSGAPLTNPAPDLDPDRPDADLFPRGFMLWNTRYSTNNVKQWNSAYTVKGILSSPDNTNNNSTGRWVSASGTDAKGQPYMGDRAQNIMIARAIQQVILNNEELQSEDVTFNLIAAPGCVEAVDEMLQLNTMRKETAFVIGDSPFTLSAQATKLQSWANNSNLSLENNETGLVTSSKYAGVWYPSGLSTNVNGSNVVVPPSHMALRTLAYNDQVAYPWFAPAGLQRGVVSNATSVGYVDESGKFVPVRLSGGQNDTLYNSSINPIRIMPDGAIVVYGQKTRQPYSSATDRINVVRLENYLRYNLDILARPFLFEPNDAVTRESARLAFERFLSELVTLRGIDDFLVVCDETNNTPSRIDRNELWIDVIFSPTRAIEFIYIPMRIVNTGGVSQV